MANLNIWWSALTIAQKERIAAKAAEKEGNKDADVRYPACSRWWISISEEQRQWIYDHCTDTTFLTAHLCLSRVFQWHVSVLFPIT